MEKEFVPYEQALALKELGFDLPCFGKFYFNQLEIGGVWTNNDFKEDPDFFISAPLYQQAFRWFREKYDFKSWIQQHTIDTFFYEIRPHVCSDYRKDETYVSKIYEEAELECLKKLIEIIKNK